ncbi:MAG: VOC family protein [Cellvibrionaceae bacterium]
MSEFAVEVPTIAAPLGRIRQAAYVVKNLEQAMHFWRTERGVESFIVARDAKPLTNASYRGAKNHSVIIDLAFGYLGDLQIELIELKHATASIYQEALDRNQVELQHYGVVVEDFDRAYQFALDHGFLAVVDSGIDGIARMSYVEAGDCERNVFSASQGAFMKTPEGHPIMLELIEWNSMTRPYFDKIQAMVKAVPEDRLFVEFSLHSLTPVAELIKRLVMLLWNKSIGSNHQSVTIN